MTDLPQDALPPPYAFVGVNERLDGFVASGTQEGRACVAVWSRALIESHVAALRQRCEDIGAALKDPTWLHVNMLRGIVAIPSWRNMVDLRGEVPNGEDVQLSRIAQLQEELAESRRAFAALWDDRGAAIARAEQAERDALRYRWLRTPGNEQADVCYSYTGNEMDAAIDAAIAANTNPGSHTA